MLLIEDDPDNRALFAELLAEARIDALCVSHDALPEPDPFQLVVTDLPSQVGYSTAGAKDWVTLLLSRYRAPVIVVTGRHEARAELRNVAAVIEKPIDIDSFVATIRATALESSGP